MPDERCRLPNWQDLKMTAQDAAELIEDGLTVGMSGFTLAGEAKEVPLALAERAADEPLSIFLMTGASLGNDIDAKLTGAGVIARRLPFQVDATLRDYRERRHRADHFGWQFAHVRATSGQGNHPTQSERRRRTRGFARHLCARRPPQAPADSDRACRQPHR